MKRIIAIVGAAALLGTAIAAQERAPAKLQAALDSTIESFQAGGSIRMAVEARVTRGKPYSGEAVTEFVQVLGDGNRITRKTTARLFRDGEGRTRREDNSEAAGSEIVSITDPVAGTSFILRPASRTATKTAAAFAKIEGGATTYTMTRAGGAGAVEPKIEVFTLPEAEVRLRESASATVAVGVARGAAVAVGGGRGGAAAVRVAGPGESTKEDLGQQQIEGVAATGSRTTTVIPAGAIGNEAPITIVSEQWFSTDLNALVLTRHSDPRVGETTYRMLNISLTEPDRSLFQVPADYTVEELRKPPMMWQQQPK